MLHKCGIVCFMWAREACNCVLYVALASMELCALCGLCERGIVCFVLSPQAWNCNVIHKC